jgi:hypothetical protein
MTHHPAGGGDRAVVQRLHRRAGKATDAQLGEEVSTMGRRTGQSRAAAMITITTDGADHYSTAAAYLRLNGILPPTAQPKK